MSSKAESGEALYRTGFNCAQAVLTTLCWQYGLNRELGARLACGLGGGLCSGEVCGAVSAGVLVIGLKYGNSLPDDKLSKKRCREQTRQFVEAFRARHGSILCRELLARALQGGAGTSGQATAPTADRASNDRASSERISRAACPGFVADAIRLLEAAGC